MTLGGGKFPMGCKAFAQYIQMIILLPLLKIRGTFYPQKIIIYKPQLVRLEHFKVLFWKEARNTGQCGEDERTGLLLGYDPLEVKIGLRKNSD